MVTPGEGEQLNPLHVIGYYFLLVLSIVLFDRILLHLNERNVFGLFTIDAIRLYSPNGCLVESRAAVPRQPAHPEIED